MGKGKPVEGGLCWCRDCKHRTGITCMCDASPNFKESVPPLGSCEMCHKADPKEIKRRRKEER